MKGKILTLRAPSTIGRMRIGYLTFPRDEKPEKPVGRKKKRRGR